MFPFQGRSNKRGGMMPFGFGPARHGQDPGVEGFAPNRFLHDLDLNDEQVERIAELKAGGMAKIMQVGAEGGQYLQKLMHELSEEIIDLGKVNQAHDALLEHHKKAAELMLSHAVSFSETLTPAQRKKLKRTATRHMLGLDDSE